MGEVHVLVPTHSDVGYFSEKNDIHKIYAPADILKTFLQTFNVVSMYRTIKYISSIDPDVIHILNTHPWNVLVCKFYSGNAMKVFTLHDPVPHESSLPGRVTQVLLSFTERLTIKWSRIVIVHGKKLKDACVAMGVPGEKIEVVPHGDYSFFRKYTADEAPRSGKKTVLFFGRIEPYKGIEYFIEAAKKANASIPGSTFIIAGDGDFRPYRGLVKNNGIFNIINRYIDDREVAELFSSADLVVLPYISATQSGVIPIAYAFKKPVIVTNVGALPEVVDDGATGLIVPPKDAGPLSGAIIKLLKDDELARTMGENAYRKMNNELSWDLISRKLVSIYSGTVS
jgi:glycosyltransferase involved in cell wall biosynthesis